MAESKPPREQIWIEIITWNPERGNKCKGHFVDLKNLFSEFLFRRIPTSKILVCGQEMRKNAASKNLHTSFHEGTGVISPDSKSDAVYSAKDIEFKSEGYDLSDLHSRCSGQHLTHKQKNIEFILISFHGEHKSLKDYEKQRKLEKFIDGMITLANNHEVVVIVGGDFNIEVIKWKTEIENKFAGRVVVAPLYAGASNQRNGDDIIDTFIAVYPDHDKNDVRCEFDTPIPIYILPAKGYVGDIDDETNCKFVDYPNKHRPCCKVLNYDDEELREIKDTIFKKNFEESRKDKNTDHDAILPLWPKCESLKECDHDPVMVTARLISLLKEQSTTVRMADSKQRREQAISIEIITWNPKRSSKGHFAELEQIFSRFLFNRISTSKTLVCEQDVDETAVLNTCEKRNLHPTFYKENVVISSKSGISEVVYSAEEIEFKNERYDLSDLHSRCSGQLLTHKQTNIKFILISFHGEHKSLKDCEKEPRLVKFIDGMITLANNYEVVVIVGGDFNIEVIKWKTEIENKFAGRVVFAPLYAGASNQRNADDIIDTFIAVYPDKNDVRCEFDTPIPIYILPAKGYVDVGDETKFVDYPNTDRPRCKVLNYNNEELQEIRDTILKKMFEESYKDNNADAILPLWPKCKILKEFDHDPVMVTVKLNSQLKKQECQVQGIVEPIKRLDLGQDDENISEQQTIAPKVVQEK